MRPSASRTTRSRMPATSPRRTCSPHSSAISRRTASRVVSPSSTRPPGRLHLPISGGLPRRTRSTRVPSRTTAPTPTRGTLGYSRSVMAGGPDMAPRPPFVRRAPAEPGYSAGRAPDVSRRGGQPGRARVALGHERGHALGLARRKAAGPEVEAVLALERLGQRVGHGLERRAPAEGGLERRQRRQRVARRRKQRAHPWLVHGEQDGAVLQEGVALPALAPPTRLRPPTSDPNTPGRAKQNARPGP